MFRKKTYTHHIHSTINGYLSEISVGKDKDNDNENKYRFNRLEEKVNYLYNYGIQKIQPFCEDFRKHKIKKEGISSIIEDCKEAFHDNNVTNRIRKKSNSSDLNIILTTFILKNPIVMRKKFDDFISSYPKPIKNKESLRQEINDKIEFISKMNKDSLDINQCLTNENRFDPLDDCNDSIKNIASGSPDEYDSEMQELSWDENDPSDFFFI